MFIEVEIRYFHVPLSISSCSSIMIHQQHRLLPKTLKSHRSHGSRSCKAARAQTAQSFAPLLILGPADGSTLCPHGSRCRPRVDEQTHCTSVKRRQIGEVMKLGKFQGSCTKGLSDLILGEIMYTVYLNSSSPQPTHLGSRGVPQMSA